MIASDLRKYFWSVFRKMVYGFTMKVFNGLNSSNFVNFLVTDIKLHGHCRPVKEYLQIE